MQSNRRLDDLNGIGKAMLADLALLKIRSVPQLAAADPDALFAQLSRLTNSRQDPCVLHTFRCAVAQARDPELPLDQRNWWYWSRLRKAGKL